MMSVEGVYDHRYLCYDGGAPSPSNSCTSGLHGPQNPQPPLILASPSHRTSHLLMILSRHLPLPRPTVSLAVSVVVSSPGWGYRYIHSAVPVGNLCVEVSRGACIWWQTVHVRQYASSRCAPACAGATPVHQWTGDWCGVDVQAAAQLEPRQPRQGLPCVSPSPSSALL